MHFVCIFYVTSAASGSLLSLQYVKFLIYTYVANAVCMFKSFPK